MKIRQILTVIAVLVVLFAGVANVFAESPTPQFPPPFPFHHMGPPPPASVCTDGKYLYVVIGPKVLVYATPNLTLHTSVDLPKPAPPGKK